MANCSEAKRVPVRPKPVWTSSATKTMPCFLQVASRTSRKPVGRDDESALAEDWLDDDRRDVFSGDDLVEDVCEHALEVSCSQELLSG